MVYEYGVLPPAKWQTDNAEIVNESYEFQEGEIGGFATEREEWFYENQPVLTESEIAQQIISKIESEGAKVTYVRVERQWMVNIPHQRKFNYKIHCVFKGSPIAVGTILLIIAGILAILTIIILAPVIWKYAGLTPEEVEDYLGSLTGAMGGTFLPIIILALIVFAILFLFSGKRRD